MCMYMYVCMYVYVCMYMYVYITSLNIGFAVVSSSYGTLLHPLSLRPLVSDGEGHKEGLEQGWAHTSLHSFSF